MAQMTLMTGPERRRRWRSEEKSQILAEAFAPGAVVADVARRYDVATSLVYQWRREAAAFESPGFVPGVVADGGGEADRGGPRTALVVDLPGGVRVRVAASAPASVVAAALRALR